MSQQNLYACYDLEFNYFNAYYPVTNDMYESLIMCMLFKLIAASWEPNNLDKEISGTTVNTLGVCIPLYYISISFCHLVRNLFCQEYFLWFVAVNLLVIIFILLL